jgi:hypothetical protein
VSRQHRRSSSASSNGVEVVEVRRRLYVTITNAGGANLLACYRVRNDGKLKRLVRVPEELKR